jgi:hypothetical protein
VTTLNTIGTGTWRDGKELFHQSTVVLAEDGKWYALEQHFASAKPVEEWFHYYYNQSNDGKTRLYITEPNRFTPELSRYDNFQMGIWGGSRTRTAAKRRLSWLL